MKKLYQKTFEQALAQTYAPRSRWRPSALLWPPAVPNPNWR